MARIVPATEEWIRSAAEVIRVGGLVAFPTETVYGLGANALDAEAVARIFEVKGRPPTNPVIVHIAEADQVGAIADDTNPFVAPMAAEFWPGPLTLVLPKRDIIPKIVTAGGDTVGVRVPNHPVALALLRAAKVPIAAPSANRSESVSPTTAEHVAASLGDAVDLILDGGPCGIGLESTVLNLTSDPPSILRPGAITVEQIERAIGIRPSVRSLGGADSKAPLQSPGQMPRHYAPMTPLRISENALDEANRSMDHVAIITHQPGRSNDSRIRVHSMPSIAADYARLLYAALREIDASGVSLILVQAVPDTANWLAVRDRLSRAATPES